MMEFGPKIVIPCIAMGIEMNHAHRAICGDGTKYGQRNRVIAPGRYGNHIVLMNDLKKLLNFIKTTLQVKWGLHPGIPHVCYSTQRMGIDAA
jgi:hypothetical protein